MAPRPNSNTSAAPSAVVPVSVVDVDTKKGDVVDPEMQTVNLSKSGGLSWSHIGFSVGDKEILSDVHGSGSAFTAIMGPSGAGKSTLMNILAGRVRTQGKLKVRGDVMYEGKVVDPVTFSSRIAYVMQEDALFATQTPREAFHFSAALRLGADLTVEDRTDKVEKLLELLKLGKCADTMIGNVMIKGISGGEKKRTAIGIELISDPSILFLDEPTSGLDSFAAYNVVKLLGELSRKGRAILCTIHQPSSEVWAEFDETLLLCNGRLVFHDDSKAMLPFFATQGFTCPTHYNPADFVMFVMQEQAPETMKKVCDTWAAAHPAPAAIADQGAAKEGRGGGDDAADDDEDDKPQRPGCCTEMMWLAQREAQSVARNKVAIIAQCGTTIFLYVIIGCIFYQSADYSDATADPQNMAMLTNTHFGLVTFVAVGSMFGLAQPIMLAFPLERPIFLREYASGVYGVLPYFLSKLMVEVPQSTMVVTLTYLIAYWLVGFQGAFGMLVLYTTCFGLVAASVSLLIGSLAPNVEVGVQLTPLLFVPQLLFCGFYIPITQIPEWLRWAQYTCSLKFALNLLMITEMKDVPESLPASVPDSFYNMAVFGCPNVTSSYECDGVAAHGSGLFPKTEIDVAHEGVYIGVLIAIFLSFRLLAFFALMTRSRA